jgi:hypothetical protein
MPSSSHPLLPPPPFHAPLPPLPQPHPDFLHEGHPSRFFDHEAPTFLPQAPPRLQLHPQMHPEAHPQSQSQFPLAPSQLPPYPPPDASFSNQAPEDPPMLLLELKLDPSIQAMFHSTSHADELNQQQVTPTKSNQQQITPSRLNRQRVTPARRGNHRALSSQLSRRVGSQVSNRRQHSDNLGLERAAYSDPPLGGQTARQRPTAAFTTPTPMGRGRGRGGAPMPNQRHHSDTMGFDPTAYFNLPVRPRQSTAFQTPTPRARGRGRGGSPMPTQRHHSDSLGIERAAFSDPLVAQGMRHQQPTSFETPTPAARTRGVTDVTNSLRPEFRHATFHSEPPSQALARTRPYGQQPGGLESDGGPDPEQMEGQQAASETPTWAPGAAAWFDRHGGGGA